MHWCCPALYIILQIFSCDPIQGNRGYDLEAQIDAYVLKKQTGRDFEMRFLPVLLIARCIVLYMIVVEKLLY